MALCRAYQMPFKRTRMPVVAFSTSGIGNDMDSKITEGGLKMKKLLFLLAIIILSPDFVLAQNKTWEIRPRNPDYTRPYGEAGSASNPWQVRERWDGSLEIRSRQQDFNRPFMAPGSPSNPWIVKPLD